MNHPSLEARHLCRAFGNLRAVDDVSLSLEAGKVVVLLGQSGSGKSTLLRILAGLEGLDSGEVFASGVSVASAARTTPPEQRGLGMVFQDYALFPHLSAQNNVAFGLQSLGKSRAQEVALDWLSKVGLADRVNAFPHQLSGGEQQRVALARALAPQPKAILMDEPFSGLDPHLRTDLQRTMLATLREAGVAALIVSHDAEEALAIADVVAIMDQGRIVQSGSPREVYNVPVSLAVARALGPVWAIATRGENGIAQTAVGTFTTTLTGPIVIAGRPEATSLVPDLNGDFTIVDVRGVSRDVVVTAQSGEHIVQAKVPTKTAPCLGQKVAVSIETNDVFLFQNKQVHPSATR
jgi:iron(III) transport system ATP-binding protein